MTFYKANIADLHSACWLKTHKAVRGSTITNSVSLYYNYISFPRQPRNQSRPSCWRYDLCRFRVVVARFLSALLIPFSSELPRQLAASGKITREAVGHGFDRFLDCKSGTCSTCHVRRALSITRKEHVSRKLDMLSCRPFAAWNLPRRAYTRYGRALRTVEHPLTS